MPLDGFRDAQQRLIAAFGTDKSVHDLPRVLRLPGFPHQKVNVKKGQTGEKFQVAVVNNNSCCSDMASMGERKPPRDAEQTRVLLDAIDGRVSRPTKLEEVPRNKLTVADVPAPAMGLSPAEIDDILARIPVARLNYSDWVHVGMALHHEGALFAVFERWSSVGDSRFEPDACRAKWDSFGRYSGQPVTMRTIILMANWDGGRAHKVVADILKRLDAIVLPLIEKPYKPSGDGDIMGLSTPADASEEAELPEEAEDATEEATEADEPPLPVPTPKEALKPDVVTTIIETSFYCVAGRPYRFLNRRGDLVEFSEPDAWKYLTQTFGSPVPAAVIDQWGGLASPKVQKALRKAIAAAIREPILDEIKLNRQRSTLAWRVDMFSAEPVFELREFDVQITLPHRPLIQGPFEQRFIDDFREHWPEVDRVLAFIAAARFAGDRKKAFLWWLASSDFGKGFFMGQLTAAGVVASTSVKEIEKVMEGAPVGLSADSFKRAMVLWIDEFKNVKSELKQLQNEITLSPKFQMRQRVEIFSKIFTSAESVASLVGSAGVEAQFANRMALIEGQGSLDDRALFQESQAAYALSIRNWIATALNTHIANYQAMGREQATNVADRALGGFHSEFGIAKRFGNLDDGLKDIAADFCDDLRERRAYEVVELSGGGYCVKSPSKVLADWLRDHYDDSEYYTLIRKKPDILRLASADGDLRLTRWTAKGKAVKGLLMPHGWYPA